MEGKAHVVGTVVDQSLFRYREVCTHETNIKITAKHTTGGTKNFTVTVTYSVEESSTMTRIFVPCKGKWANILSVDIREKKKPAIPQPPGPHPHSNRCRIRGIKCHLPFLTLSVLIPKNRPTKPQAKKGVQRR